jgi:phage terminase large subunit-like protein
MPRQQLWAPVEDNLSSRGPKRALQVVEMPPWVRWRTSSESSRAIRWIEEYLPVPVGYGAGEPMRLAGFQKRIIRTMYDHLAAFVSIPAANGKSTLLAAVAVERLCRGDAYTEVIVLATKREQAAIMVEAAKRFVKSVPELASRCVWYADAGILEFKPTGSRLQAHPARLSSLQGLNFSLAVVDEVGFADDPLIEALIARLAKRPDARLIGIGTPGFEPNMLHRLREDHADGSLPRGVAYLEWAAPAGADHHDQRAWRQANPALAAGFMGPEALAIQADLLPERAFRVYHLGQWVDQAAGWLPAGAWQSNPVTEPPPPDTDVVLAVEGTYRRTLAVVGCALDGTLFFCWAAEAATDDELRHVLDQACEQWNVVEVTYPKRIRTRLFDQLRHAGLPVEPWDSKPDNEAASANELYRAIIDARVPHDHHPLLEEHVAQLAVRTNVDGSLRLTRPDTGQHVDAALAARAAWWRAFQLADQNTAEPIRIY